MTVLILPLIVVFFLAVIGEEVLKGNIYSARVGISITILAIIFGATAASLMADYIDKVNE